MRDFSLAVSYRLEKGHPLGTDLPRIGAELTAAIRLDLVYPAPEGVHEARKRCKMLRALVRLIDGGAQTQRKIDAATRSIRKLAHQLCGTRDAAVRLETFLHLSVPDTEGLEHRLATEAEVEMQHQFSSSAQLQAQEAIDAIDRALSKFDWRKVSREHLAVGIATSYRRARNGYRSYIEDPVPELGHRWRKRAKEFMYHIQLLSVICPKKLEGLAKRLDQLTDILGVDHDLVVLQERLRRWSESERWEFAVIEERIDERHEEHRRIAKKLGKRLFKKSPRDFVERMERWWRKA